MKKWWIKSGDEWFKVKGFVNPKGWLEWSSSDGTSGLSRPIDCGTKWIERRGLLNKDLRMANIESQL